MNGLFGVNGLLGFLVAVVLVVGLAIGFGTLAVSVQSNNAQNYYKIENYKEIKAQSVENKDFFQDVR
ncbi:DUF4006 family protein [uncultured Helicobacter sp.]|uniref:DUF4006 family protein n=1 Tax=uncultured Helicobacter sp. TaxID=175537 RepID=UPI002620CC9A|nr:DUF4006 family protein [uncultured Helicobacter sp.]